MKSINEILGTIQTSRGTGGQRASQYPLGRGGSTPSSGTGDYVGYSDVIPYCTQMRSWQKEIYFKLIGGVDVYVAASPGGGKTLPYLCYWLDGILDLNVTLQSNQHTWENLLLQVENILTNSGDIKKLVIMVPTRSLADQTVQEFKEHFSNILSMALEKAFSLAFQKDAQGNHVYIGWWYGRIVRMLNAIDPTGQAGDLLQKRRQLWQTLSDDAKNTGQAISGNDQHKSELLAQMDQDLNFIITNSIREITSGARGEQGSLICLRTGLNNMGDPKVAPVCIGIYESAQNMIGPIKDKIKLIVTDESHLAQEREMEDDKRRHSIALALYNVLGLIKGQQGVRLCFLSGTEDPNSASNLAEYLEKCFKRNMEVIKSSAINASNINVVPDDSISQERELLKIILNPRQTNNLIVLFSKKRIDKLVELAMQKSGMSTAFQVDRGQNQPYDFSGGVIGKGYSGFKKTAKWGPNVDAKNIAQQASKVPGAAKIFDPVLRQAVNAGFGYIYRIDDKDPQMRTELKERGRDMMIVANLFKTGKIKTLLATDAVGIGVNIDVRNLFIPSIDKIQGGRFQPMKDTELAQLLHRAGRGAFTFSTVITPSKNVPTVANALSMGTSDFESTITIEYMPRAACASGQWFITLWNATIGRRLGRI